MTPICVSAPGKAVISGEYAVLFGAPAIVTAVNRRATVCITDSADRYHHVSVPGLADGNWRFHVESDGNINWYDDVSGGFLDLFECAWRHCAGESTLPVAIEIDTQAFFDLQTGAKFGLGSSAAATAALAAALNPADGNGREIWSLARRIHHDYQQGHGSGVDIAASVFGGMLAYRMEDEGAPSSLSWPEGLHSRFLWSGTAADTRAKLQQLGDRDERETAVLTASAEHVATAWVAGEPGGIIDALNHYVTALARFSEALDLGIFEAGHGEMLAAAKDCNVVYKPCGAGGGDIGVVLAESVDAVEEFCNRVAQCGFAMPGLDRDPRGLSVLEEDRS